MAAQTGRTRSAVPNNRLLRSIVKPGSSDSVTDQARATFGNFFLQLHSVKVRRKSLSWNYTFGLGLISLYLFIILLVSGLALMFYYVPAIERAYGSMLDLKSEVTFGVFVRNIHRWSAHGLIIFAVLHMLRVFYTGAYKRPRQLNWVIGVILLLMTGMMAFTGYLLPWDQQAFWAVQIGSEVVRSGPILGEHVQRILFGGPDIGQAALLRFYVLHVAVLPLTALLLVGVHLWRVRRDGGLAMPSEPTNGQAADGDQI